VPSIILDKVGLDFPQRISLRNRLGAFRRPPLSESLASQRRTRQRILDDVSLHLVEGDSIAIVGPNGAGKTTLLRCLAGLYQPTRGRVDVRGRVISLINWSTGLDMEETGRQNIHALGYYLGLTNAELRLRIDEIIEFSGLGEYVDFPIHTYSAGMTARLAFAVSTSVKSDILLLDEGINAGDAEFQAKAQRRVRELLVAAGIVVLATHASSLAQVYCRKGLFLLDGRVQFFGSIDDTLSNYREFVGPNAA
jgi:ABC-type polysaccharide/polyol phosphate transport system ATPase subunit